MSLNRPRQVYAPPHTTSCFAKVEADAEAAFEEVAERAERVSGCFTLIDPTPHVPGMCGCEPEMPNYEVTPGGLSYQDAALQCLREGGVRTLRDISLEAAARALRECRAGLRQPAMLVRRGVIEAVELAA
jgi:hypothetical protein